LAAEIPEELLRKWREEDEEARRIRRSEADWSFIEKQPPRIKAALKYYVEAGDIRRAAKLAGLSLDEFNELRKKANIPVVC